MKSNCVNDYKEMGYTIDGKKPTPSSTTKQVSLDAFLAQGYANPLKSDSNGYYYLVDTKNSKVTEDEKSIILVAVYPNVKLFNRPDKTQFYGAYQVEHFTVSSNNQASIIQADFFDKKEALAHTDKTHKELKVNGDSILIKQLEYLEK